MLCHKTQLQTLLSRHSHSLFEFSTVGNKMKVRLLRRHLNVMDQMSYLPVRDTYH